VSEQIAGILFDKDGTLIDFEATWFPAYRAAAERLVREVGGRGTGPVHDLLMVGGCDPLAGTFRPASVLASGSNAQIASLWAAECEVDDVRWVEGLLVEEFGPFASRPAPVMDLKGLFRRLRARGLALGVATMDSEALARDALEALGLSGLLDFVCGADSGFGIKPDSGMVEAFCHSTGMLPNRVAVVGDAPHDLRMGQTAGAGLTIGVLSGTSPMSVLEPHADAVLESIAGLEPLLDSLRCR